MNLLPISSNQTAGIRRPAALSPYRFHGFVLDNIKEEVPHSIAINSMRMYLGVI
jgi:hypothetical protein